MDCAGNAEGNMNRGDTLSEGLESRILDARVYAACALCLAMDK